MAESASLESFLDKWRARWPEWGVLLVFVPRGQRVAAAAWYCLLQELADAAWGGGDPTPGLAKLAWWQEELRGWARGARRHPLGDALQKQQAPWEALGRALTVLPATRSPESAEGDVDALRAFAVQLLACEAAMFGGRGPDDHVVVDVVAGLRAERSLVQGDPGMATGLRPGLRPCAPSRPRRLQQVVVRERLRLMEGGGPSARPASLRMLLAGWRAARG
ncbi:squalene/phytoene synthase family protein [Luteimonas saliphila]|uniref:squalene/phytoene synthase family protein n=1 Tax=Luteimonas saliphila TaxID=2804919 RepID=UPI00192D5C60|nr:squalene/phytoene synthase family protein [Luteimonas saliphila]